ncbi:PadR family transcriptional regulator [bacterium]|nr:MAG: PadR family transcriptional regulator [bacterium]
MTIQYAILGLLNWRPFSGYELKKVFADSSVFYWSGNNNQIYTALVQLHKEKLVTQEIEHQETLPARKTYTITPEGQAVLKRWLLSAPELPEFHNNFLIQLTWADMLEPKELDSLLANYEAELSVQILMQQEKARRPATSPSRTPREVYLWEMISHNIVSIYENELSWVHQLRSGLKTL